MSPNSNHLNFTFCAGCSRILILHSMAGLCWLVAGLCWLVTGLLYLRKWSSLLWKEETVPSLPTALCWPGLRSWTAARVISVHRGCSQLRTRGSHHYSQPVSPVSCPPSLTTDNDEPSLEPSGHSSCSKQVLCARSSPPRPGGAGDLLRQQ